MQRGHATAAQRFQISTDGFKPNISFIANTLSDRCDFGQLIKVYVSDAESCLGHRGASGIEWGMTHTTGAILRSLGAGGIAAVVCLFTANVLKARLPWAVAIGILSAGAFSLLYWGLSRRSQN
jgi:hypothetical protein